jgi:hypothetical protein
MKKYLIAIASLLFVLPAIAQQQNALIIGIDDYEPPPKYAKGGTGRINWVTLDGCKNDALCMKDAIIGRYNFKQANIRELYNKEATRKAILDGMSELLAKSNAGDIAFIFYAGHGSQVKNSLSKEPGQVDESMVPANTWEPGVADIRDKELSKIFNEFVDKGVVLTVIYDCCHSSNMSRGISDQPKLRYIPMANYDAKDPSTPPDPSGKPNSKFLMLCACQSYQFASEARDENDQPHGAFTLALLSAMKQLSINASITDIFNNARAILKSNGKSQEPSITGSEERLAGTIFGIGKGVLSDRVVVSVMGIEDKDVTLQGGIISGLNVDNELISADGAIALKVVEMNGADKCIATVTSGDASKIKGGDLFTVTNWVSSQKSFLKIYAPVSGLSHQKVQEIAGVCNKLKSNPEIKWVYELDKQDPTVSIFYKEGKWFANTAAGKTDVNAFTAEGIAAQFKGHTIFINIPPTKALVDSFNKILQQQANVKTTTNPAEANYTLVGRAGTDNSLEYALFNSGASAKDSLETMPVSTDYEKITATSVNDAAAKLAEYAMKLGKIRVWFNLSNPSGNQGFPYALEIRDQATNKKLAGEVTVGQRITLHIVKDNTDKNNTWEGSFRYVYIFMINHHGAMQLIYPLTREGNDQNHFPDKNNPKSDDFAIPGTFKVKAPTGTDNYYMFTTDEPIVAYANVFNQAGVSKESTRGKGSGIDALLNMGNVATRDISVSAPNNWAIQKISLKTIYKAIP